MSFEYKVVPAPVRGTKAKGVKTPEERFALALQTAMNDIAADGWEYLRTDTLPSEQRDGLISKTTVYQNMLVFRRAKTIAPVEALAEPQVTAPVEEIAQDPETPLLESPQDADIEIENAPKPDKPSDVAAE